VLRFLRVLREGIYTIGDPPGGGGLLRSESWSESSFECLRASFAASLGVFESSLRASVELARRRVSDEPHSSSLRESSFRASLHAILAVDYIQNSTTNESCHTHARWLTHGQVMSHI